MENILKRRSIRKYTDKSVTDDQIKQILQAAMAAPSGGNQQPWQFIVVKDKETLKDMPNRHKYGFIAVEASCAILVCGDLNEAKYEEFWVQDCSAAIENMLIAVTSLGLGAVWLGIYPRGDRVEAMKNLFDLPEHIMPLALIPIGYPAEEKPPSNRYKESRIHWEKW